MQAEPRKRVRAHWEIVPVVGGAIGWVVERNGTEQCRFFFQWRAISFADAECRNDLEEWDIRSELLIRTRQGRVHERRYYGDAPRNIQG